VYRKSVYNIESEERLGKFCTTFYSVMCNASAKVMLVGAQLLQSAMRNRGEISKEHRVPDNCALMGCYPAGSGNLLPTFRDNLVLKRR
jgi:hypothetical protein